MKKLIRLTESDLHKIVKESVGKILKESSWADGQEMIQAYHITTVGAEDSSQEEAGFAYQIYDRLTHNEMTADEAIRVITNGDLTPDTEPEVVPRDVVTFGTSSDGRYFLTYDKYTGAFDVWERTMNESKKTKSVSEAYNPYNELQRFAYENQQVRPMIQKLADFAEDVAQIGKMRGEKNYYQFYHKLNGDILQMKNLWNFLDDIDD